MVISSEWIMIHERNSIDCFDVAVAGWGTMGAGSDHGRGDQSGFLIDFLYCDRWRTHGGLCCLGRGFEDFSD